MPLPENPRISIVIPTLDEAAVVSEAIASAAGAYEVIVVDGGSADATPSLAAACGARVLRSPRGRGRQLAVGAAAAGGDVLLFLHADSRLPTGYADAVSEVVRQGCSWGRFDLRFDGGGVLISLIAKLISWRSRLTRGATGDQAIFAVRPAYERVGGFVEEGLFEDVSLCRRLKRDGRMGIPRGYVITSARRWQQGGALRTSVRMWCLKALYLAGVSPAALERHYRNIR